MYFEIQKEQSKLLNYKLCYICKVIVIRCYKYKPEVSQFIYQMYNITCVQPN